MNSGIPEFRNSGIPAGWLPAFNLFINMERRVEPLAITSKNREIYILLFF